MTVRHYEDVTVGERLPTLSVPIDLSTLVRYSAATWDFHRCHYDPVLAQEMGMPAPFMDGQMMGALITRQLMGWGGRDAFLRRLSYRHRAVVLVGDTVRFDGEVSDKAEQDGRALILFRLAVAKADGTPIADGAEAALELSKRG